MPTEPITATTPEPRKRKRHPGHEPSVRHAIDALVKGVHAEEIVRAIVAKWEVSEKSARNWVNEAKAVLKGESVEIRREYDMAFARAVRRRDRMFREAFESGDLRLALSIEQEPCRLLGLYPDEKVTVRQENRSAAPADLTDEELIAVIRAGQKGEVEIELEPEEATPEAEEAEPGEAPKSDEATSPEVHTPALTGSALEAEPVPSIEPAVQPAVESAPSESKGAAPRAGLAEEGSSTRSLPGRSPGDSQSSGASGVDRSLQQATRSLSSVWWSRIRSAIGSNSATCPKPSHKGQR